MKQKRADLLSYLLIGTIVLVTLALYPHLPERMPTHWNAAGEVDGWSDKPIAVSLFPLMALATLVLMKLIPHISPRGFGTGEFAGVLAVFQLALVAFLTLVGVLTLVAGFGIDVHMDRTMFAGIGLLFVVIGNYLGKTRRNFFLGIRTPWTLASDEVWSRTHRLGGHLFVGGGALLIVAGLFGMPPMWTLVLVLVITLIPVGYSYLLYRRLEGFDDDGTPPPP